MSFLYTCNLNGPNILNFVGQCLGEHRTRTSYPRSQNVTVCLQLQSKFSIFLSYFNFPLYIVTHKVLSADDKPFTLVVLSAAAIRDQPLWILLLRVLENTHMEKRS